MRWCVDHTLSEILPEGLDEFSTASWIGKDGLHNAVLRWLQMREIRIETSPGKRLARCQIKVAIGSQQLAGGQLVMRFPYLHCRYRDLCHFRISAVGQRQPEVGVR